MIIVKKIVPFNNILTFNTDVREITAISLEHEIKKDPSCISGVFLISGEYKITDGQLEKDKFNFELPFDIALGNEYDMNTLEVDIDDFRYELIDNRKLKVNIDLYIDGEVLMPPIDTSIDTQEVSKLTDTNEDNNLKELEEETKNKTNKDKPEESREESNFIPTETLIDNDLDLLNDLLDNKKENHVEEEKKDINITNNVVNENINDNNNDNDTKTTDNIFNAFNEDEEYVTYRVYRVMENDTLNTILDKYNVTKEELAKYNNIEEIHPGVKLIIPANDK